ncbi:LysE family translocator [Erwinia phyllosphaerae]|uniref:LysE family translocator n=1 Tax=Erwinia phyllosphaerae TaxID=2853256 RepID=UPI001FEF6F3F|nr:LysE family translocator [Erwinia phyllosphaerae]MBV4367257.1 LysE family translocator [Erwinia phyllosphaerae]
MFYAAFIYIMAVISPGPNFILVSRYSALGSIKLGLAVTLGICTIGACFSTLSLLGLSSVIHLFPAFAKISVILGALYLLYIAWAILLSTLQRKSVSDGDTAPDAEMAGGLGKAFRTGALTNVLNMKTIAFMISIYSGFLAVPRSITEQIVIVVICSSLEFSWYFFVTVIFSSQRIKSLFYRYRKVIDRGLALFLTLFAMQNIYSVI